VAVNAFQYWEKGKTIFMKIPRKKQGKRGTGAFQKKGTGRGMRASSDERGVKGVGKGSISASI